MQEGEGNGKDDVMLQPALPSPTTMEMEERAKLVLQVQGALLMLCAFRIFIYLFTQLIFTISFCTFFFYPRLPTPIYIYRVSTKVIRGFVTQFDHSHAESARAVTDRLSCGALTTLSTATVFRCKSAFDSAWCTCRSEHIPHPQSQHCANRTRSRGSRSPIANSNRDSP